MARPSPLEAEYAGFDALREQTASLLGELSLLATGHGANSAADRVALAAAALRTANLTIVVCGEFKRGKSSLLNALLAEQPPLLPTDTVLTTSTVTAVSWAERERVAVHVEEPDGSLREVLIDRARIAEWATETGNPGNTRRVKLVSVETPNPLLRNGLTFVDTPGVGGVLREHSAATAAVLPRADAIVFVTDFTQPPLQSELEFLQHAVRAAGRGGNLDGLLLVVTKSDLLGRAAQQQMLRATTDALAAATGAAPGSLRVVAVSSLAKLDHVRYGDPDDLAASGFPELESALSHAVRGRRVHAVLSPAFAALDGVSRALLDPLTTELRSLLAANSRVAASVRDEATRRNAELDQLQRAEAEWRTELRQAMEQTGRELRGQARDQHGRVWHWCDTRYLPDRRSVDDPAWLVQQLAADLGLVVEQLNDQARSRATELRGRFARRYGVELSQPLLDALPAPVVTVPDLGRPPGSGGAARGRMSAGNAVEGTVAVLAALAFGDVIGLVLSVIGIVGATRSASGAQNSADIEARRTLLVTRLQSVRAELVQQWELGIDRLVRSLESAVADELATRIRLAREGVTRALRALDEADRRSEGEAGQRRAQIERQMEPLRRVRDQLAALATQAARLAGTDPPGRR